MLIYKHLAGSKVIEVSFQYGLELELNILLQPKLRFNDDVLHIGHL